LSQRFLFVYRRIRVIASQWLSEGAFRNWLITLTEFGDSEINESACRHRYLFRSFNGSPWIGRSFILVSVGVSQGQQSSLPLSMRMSSAYLHWLMTMPEEDWATSMPKNIWENLNLWYETTMKKVLFKVPNTIRRMREKTKWLASHLVMPNYMKAELERLNHA